jgi:DNA-binding LytR/AlgR family response regulator
MKVIIVEDEITATRKLEGLIHKLDSSVEVIAKLDTVKDTVNWIKNNTAPDLGFFDIQLADDISFSIFEKCNIDFPIVFITAYDDYLLKAFDHNSIHYILKPINEEKIKKAFQKIKHLERHFVSASIKDLLSGKKSNYINRVIVRKGMDYVPLESCDISYIFSEYKTSFVIDKNHELYIADQPLIELEKRLDPSFFFKANRQYIINIKSIVRFKSIEQSKIKLELKPKPEREVIIGKENAGTFRKWIKGG